MLSRLGATSAAELSATLGADLTASDRQELLHDFDIGRAGLSFYFNVKLSAWHLKPLSVFSLGHPDPHVARREAGNLLQEVAWPPVPQLHGVSREAMQDFHDGTPLTAPQLSSLRDFILCLQLTPTSERQAEGQHAKTHLRGLVRRHHSEYFQSYGLRAAAMQVSCGPPDDTHKRRARAKGRQEQPIKTHLPLLTEQNAQNFLLGDLFYWDIGLTFFCQPSSHSSVQAWPRNSNSACPEGSKS